MLAGVAPPPPASAPKNAPRTRLWVVLIAVAVLSAAGLLLGLSWQRPGAKPAPQPYALGWRSVVSFSGHGSTQTEPFAIETGQWRIKWKTTPRSVAAETGKSDAAAKPTASIASSNTGDAAEVPSGTKFRLVVHSLVSGRFVSVAADHQGPGSGVFYLEEEPRQFFFVIDSAGLNWSVEVEEGVAGEEENSR